MNESLLHGLTTPREITMEFVRALWSRKFLILIVFVAAVLSGYAYLQLLTERYQSEATLLVKLGRENTELPVSVARGAVTTLGVREEEINSNVTLLESQYLVAEVVDQMGPEAFAFELPPPTTWLEEIKYRVKSAIRWVKTQYQEFLFLVKLEKRLDDRQKTIDYIHKFLAVERVRNSDTIRVTVSLPDPNLAQEFEEHLLERYFERHISVRSMAISSDFFDNQVDLYRAEVDKLDRQIVELRDSKDLSAVDLQRDLLLSRLAKINEELDESQSQLIMLANDDSTAAAADEVTAPSGSGKRLFPVYRSEKLQDYAVDKYLDRLGIVAVQGTAGSQLKSIDEETEQIENQLKGGLQRRIDQLIAWRSDLRSRLAVLNEGEIALQKLERDRLLNQQTFFKYAQRLEDDRIASELDQQRIANVSVLTPPTASFKPVYPNKKMSMMIAIAGGLVGAIGLALVLAYLDDTIRQPRDVATMGEIEVLGKIQLPRRQPAMQLVESAR